MLEGGMRTHTCRQCGKVFANPNPRKFCSVECHNIAQTKVRPRSTCRWCGQSFVPKDHHNRPGQGMYCSRACRDDSQRKIPEIRFCRVCGKAFTAKQREKGWYCSRTCQYKDREKPLAERFWARVDRSHGDQSCWIWTGAKNRQGYGTIAIDRRPHIASRVMWELMFGPVPEGLEVCHNCPGGDNPACVQPLHLWLGTHQENMEDAVRKGAWERKKE